MRKFADLLDRFVSYTAFDTMSNSALCGKKRPTADGEEELLLHLKSELEALGLEVYYGKEKVVAGKLKGNSDGEPVAFMAHVDTADDVPGNGVKAMVWPDYDGSDIVLDGITIERKTNPDLGNYIGGTIITSSGDTLLGADDKAGVAIIMEALGYLVSHPEIRHPDIEVFFTPDEETGSGMSEFPYEKMESRICYTFDGGREGEVETECFNAASVRFSIHGTVFHFGDARGRMHNALTAAAHIVTALPGSESPEATDGRYGYYCPTDIKGTAGEAELSVIIRDFSEENFERRLKALQALAESIGLLHGVSIKTDVDIQYRNMAKANSQRPEALEAVYKAAEKLSIKLEETFIRGGTDGAALAYNGIASPNIFTGAHNMHSLTEWVALEAMERGTELLLAIIEEMVR